MISRHTCIIPGAPAAFQVRLQQSQERGVSQTALLWFEVFHDLSLVLREVSSTLPDLSPTLSDLLPVLPDLSPALPGAPKVLSGAMRFSQTYHNHSHSTPVPIIRDLPVTPKACRNALLQSDTLLKLTHWSFHSTSSQILLEAPSD